MKVTVNKYNSDRDDKALFKTTTRTKVSHVEIVTEHSTFRIAESDDGICISDGGNLASTLAIMPRGGNMVHVSTLNTAQDQMLARAQQMHKCWQDKYLSPMQASSSEPLDNEERTMLKNLHTRYKNWKAAKAKS